VGGIVKYAVPGRGLKTAGVPSRTLVAGGLLGIVGFFVIPVVGLVVGFVLGVYLAELQRVGLDAAWSSTRAALQAAGLSLLIELAAGLLAAAAWLVGAVAV
jgi:ABC-type Fe3+ transport system permease subunit